MSARKPLKVFAVVSAWTGSIIALFKSRQSAEAEAAKYSPIDTLIVEHEVSP